MARTILVVDDNGINRQLLRRILSTDYTVMEAEDGQDAINLLMANYQQISAILLDIIMPVMDGYEVLAKIQKNPTLSQIPVIVITGSTDPQTEEKALTLGATDFVTKPFDTRSVKQRVQNLIKLRETSAMVNSYRRDQLTGLWNRATFFEKAARAIATHPESFYVLSSIDIDNFKVINDQYGTEKGDDLLKELADRLQRDCDMDGSVCGRIAGDEFAVLFKSELLIKDPEKEHIREASIADGLSIPLTISIGRYLVDDKSLSISAMYDRAKIALSTVSGRYDVHIAKYNEAMLARLTRVQEITNEMNSALDSGQFEPWFQPQYNHATGALVGAEALARWLHPEHGLISPDEFVPIFERTGFIYQLDKYIWESVCVCLRKWLDEGQIALPVSVNVSRYDLFKDDVVDVLVGLREKYSLPEDLLRIEITESAFAGSTLIVVDVAKKLISCGFTVEIDDFGSGYSSFNTLKDVPSQVLKLDMRFLDSSDYSGRGGGILESIVRMAKWLGMSVIAEGVEKMEQADFLRSIGCLYIQGYLYARPMPLYEYETLAKAYSDENRLVAMKTAMELDNTTIWDPESMDTLIFNSYVGAACIFEYRGGRVEVLRANEKYAKIFGDDITLQQAMSLPWSDALDDDGKAEKADAMRLAIKSGGEVTSESVYHNFLGDGRDIYIRSIMRVISSAGDRHLVYCYNENTTAQRESEKKEQQAAERTRVIMENINSGVSAASVGEDGKVKLIFANDSYYSMLGYTKNQFETELGTVMDAVHPDDRERALYIVGAILNTRGRGDLDYRCVKRDGSIIHVHCHNSVTEMAGIEGDVLLGVTNDITHAFEAQRKAVRLSQQLSAIMDNAGNGITAYIIGDDGARSVFINDRYYDQLGYTKEQYEKEVSDVFSLLHPEDKKWVIDETMDVVRSGQGKTIEYRVIRRDGKTAWIRAVLSMTKFDSEEAPVQIGIYTDITAEREAELQLHNSDAQLQAIMANVSGGVCAMTMIDGKPHYIFQNDRYRELFGYSNEEFAQLPNGLMDFIHPGDKAATISAVYENQAAGGTASIEFRAIRKDGTVIRVRATGSICHMTGIDTPVHVVVLYDITKEAEAKEQLEAVIGSIASGITAVVLREDGTVKTLLMADRYFELLGYTKQQFEKELNNAFAPINQDDIGWVLPRVQKLKSIGQSDSLEFRAVRRDGREIWLRDDISVISLSGVDEPVQLSVFTDVTQSRGMNERLKISEAEYRLAVEFSGKLIYHYNHSGDCVDLTESVASLFGAAAHLENMPECMIEGGMLASESVEQYREFYRAIKRGDKNGTMTILRKISDGSWHWFSANFSNVFDEAGKPMSAIILFHDVTEQREKESVYKKWQQSINKKPIEDYTLFRWNVNRGEKLDSREGALIDFASPDGTAVARRVENYAKARVHPDDRKAYIDFVNADALLAAFHRGERTKTLEFRELQDDSNVRWLSLTAELVEYPDSTDVEAYMMFENIDERKKEDLAVRAQAERDPLTGVLNRSTFVERMEQMLRDLPSDAQCALFMLDVDGFKLLNDTFGHAAGDQTLIDMAETIQSVLRHGDLLGRLGGDEFLVCLKDMKGDVNIENKARQIISLLRKSFSPSVQISASIGVAVSPRDGRDFDSLYHKADTALYAMKGSGKDGFTVFRQELTTGGFSVKATAPAKVNALKSDDSTKRRILIVEDNDVNADLLYQIFKDEYLVEKVQDGASALIRLRHYGTAISVVLLDLMMPGIDGYEILNKMRANIELQTIPVIVVSGSDDKATALRVIRAGAADFVSKPIDTELIRLRVQSAIAKSENERLRAQNSLLSLNNSEVLKYRTALEAAGMVVIEYNYLAGTYVYDQSINQYIAGNFDGRRLWHILLSDIVADVNEVKAMQGLVHRLADDRTRFSDAMTVSLQTPRDGRHKFKMTVVKLVNDFQLTEKLIIIFNDLER